MLGPASKWGVGSSGCWSLVSLVPVMSSTSSQGLHACIRRVCACACTCVCTHTSHGRFTPPVQDILTGSARFVGPHTVKYGITGRVDVGGEVTAKDIIIATGSVPFVPPGMCSDAA